MLPNSLGVTKPSPLDHQLPSGADPTWTPWRQAEEPRLQGVALRLLRIVQERPGLHFRGLGRAAGLTSAGQLRHHVDRLVRCNAIAEVKDGRFSRYFASGEHDARNREGLARLARPLPMQIAALLLSRPMTRTELRRRLGCADSTLGYHLNRMVRMGDLDRRPARGPYALADPANARGLVSYLQGPRNDRPERPIGTQRSPFVSGAPSSPFTTPPSSPFTTPSSYTTPSSPFNTPPAYRALASNPAVDPATSSDAPAPASALPPELPPLVVPGSPDERRSPNLTASP